MSTPENTFISSVHRHLPVSLYHMKNHNAYNGGIADVWYSSKSDLWVEYKFLALPKRDKTEISLVMGKTPMLSPLQQRWLKDRWSEGRNIYVIVGCKEGGVIFQSPTNWEATYTTAEFKSLLYSRKDIAQLLTNHVGHPP